MSDLLSKLALSSKYKSLFKKAGININLRLSHFFGQASHESNVKPTSENLNYSVTGLINTFGRHRISKEDAQKFGRGLKPANQEGIANVIYGGEWGKKNLGNTQPGDGWKYRGRGIFQITGRANYQALTKYAQETLGLEVDYVSNPDLLLNEADSLIGAIWYWNARGLNKLADQNNILAVSKSINLGSASAKGTPKGLDDRTLKTNQFKKIFV